MAIGSGEKAGKAPIEGEKARVPPGQKVVTNWPVFTYDKVPRVDLSHWTFAVDGLGEEERSFTWQEFPGLPQVTIVSDVHCVTQWSRLGTTWEGVAARELAKIVRPRAEARFVMVHCHGGYGTNLRVEDLLDED